MARPLGAWISGNALRNPERTALIDGDTGRRETFLELEERTNRIASGLRGLGVKQGDRVALVTLNSPEMLEIIFAAAKLGAIAMPINFRNTAAEINYVFGDAEPVVAFASSAFVDTVDEAARDTSVHTVVAVGVSAQRAAGERLDFDELVDAGAPEPLEPDDRPVAMDDVAVIMYTSGTTGRPKGAMLTHTNMFYNALHFNEFGTGVSKYDVNLAPAPLFHIGALGIFTLPAVYWGGASVIMEKFDPEQYLELVTTYQVSTLFLLPTMWLAVMHTPALANTDLSSVRLALSGGAPCPLIVIEHFQSLGVTFVEGFGLTETSPGASVLGPEFVKDKAGSIGRPLSHVEYKVADLDDNEVAPGVVGELLMRGESIFTGYWNKPEASAEAMRGGWFHSGDLATYDEDGFYRIVDRKKDMIITGGENVYPAEVEQVLFRHPSVLEVSVIGAPDDYWGEAVTAVVVMKPDYTGDVAALEQEIRDFARETLAGFKVPKSVIFMAELPKTASGKIRKVDLRKQHTGSEGYFQK